MNCIHCNADNSESSVFCGNCGRRLVKHVSENAPHPPDVEKLLNDGYEALDAGKNGEALLAVESILRIDTLNASAWALKALVHERTGEIELAIDAYEELVELNPDSTHDRRRLLDLKSKRLELSRTKATPVRRASSPIWAAVGTVALLMVFMTAFALVVLRTAPERASAASRGDGVSGTGTPVNQSPATQQGAPSSQTQPLVAGQPQAAPGQPLLGKSPPDRELSGNLPDLPPIEIRDPRTGKPAENAKTNDKKSPGEGVVMPDTPDKSSAGTQPNPDRPKSIIEVQVSNGSNGNGTSAPSPGQESASLLKIARSEQQSGNYQSAIGYYKRALPGIKYPGSVYQSIALCYYHLGEYAHAADSYQQAISSYKTQIKDGVDVSRAQSGVSSCQSGLKLCKRG
jgi:tetratricopeptide (TPR) repeat protein